jgi:hypothetical protein
LLPIVVIGVVVGRPIATGGVTFTSAALTVWVGLTNQPSQLRERIGGTFACRRIDIVGGQRIAATIRAEIVVSHRTRPDC